MSTIFSSDSGNIGAGSRKKFIRRYKDTIKKDISKNIDVTKIKDIAKQRKVTIGTKSIDEPKYGYDYGTGVKRMVGNDNSKYVRGSTVDKPPSGEGRGRSKSTDDPDSEVEYEFELTKEEFVELLFEDMELPNYIKQGIMADDSYKWVRRGNSVSGIPMNLNPVKTLMAALARKIAFKGAVDRKIQKAKTEEEIEDLKSKKTPFLDDIDLRYKRYDKEHEEVKRAVMVMLMDTSGSMGEHEREIAKRFYLLLYLFLEKNYDNVEMRFITYTTVAIETDEEEFFGGKRTGGTSMSEGLELASKILKEYNQQTTNLYLAHVCDGDLGYNDNVNKLSDLVCHKILPYVQYVAYLEIVDPEQIEYYRTNFNVDISRSLASKFYTALSYAWERVGVAHAYHPRDIFQALRDLFRDE